MKILFVPYELVVKLKSLGFNEPCFAFYQLGYAEITPFMVDDDEQYRLTGWRTCRNSEIPEHYTSAPTFSQAFRWFRDKYRMFHEVFIDTEPTVDEPDKLEFTYLILHMVGTQEMFTSKNKRFDTYEEAELACLDKLLEIVESNLN